MWFGKKYLLDELNKYKKDNIPLEPYDGKLSRTFLRGERGSDASALPDKHFD